MTVMAARLLRYRVPSRVSSFSSSLTTSLAERPKPHRSFLARSYQGHALESEEAIREFHRKNEKRLQLTYQVCATNTSPSRIQESLRHALEKEPTRLANPYDHDAAIVLATPKIAPLLDNQENLLDLARILSGSFKSGSFHITYGIVDQVDSTSTQPGISILRARRENLFDSPFEIRPRAKKDVDALSTIEFGYGSKEKRTYLSLPLARTTFVNQQTSTLVQSEIDLSRELPRMKSSAHVDHAYFEIPALTESDAVEFEAPLVPLTNRRQVTESFGNIVKAIQIDGHSKPASEELEAAVHDLIKSGQHSPVFDGPIGVWAVVTPPECPVPAPQCQFSAPPSSDSIKQISRYINRLHGTGARVIRVLSGGGGWGAKKGILSLDPDQSPYQLSEEAEEYTFQQLAIVNGSPLAGPELLPANSDIQFFRSLRETPGADSASPQGNTFGVTGDIIEERGQDSPPGIEFGRFGACSNQAIYLSGTLFPKSPSSDGLVKLSVPNTRVRLG